MPNSCSKLGRPHKKLFKRSNTASAGFGRGEDQLPPVVVRMNRSSDKKMWWNNMLSGSTESLPSMPEETESLMDADDSDVERGSTKSSWSPVPVNSHLMRQAKELTHHSSMADLRMTEAEIKSRRVLAHVMAEMIQTERDYVKSLEYIVEKYIPEISREDVPQPLRGKRNVIFGNIEKIYQFHSQSFLKEIEQCENAPFQLCHFFLAHENQFYLYALYNKNKPKSDTLMAECGSVFFKEKQTELGDKMDLSSYLLKPVQRMGKYALLLKQIIKECPESEPEFQDLKSAEEMVKFQLRHGNDLLAMDSLRDCDVNLQEQGRLLRQDRFLVWQGRKKSLRHAFLFEHMIIFSKAKHSNSGHEMYYYKTSMKTSDMGLTETIDDVGYKFELWFRKRNSTDTYILQAQSVDVKSIWCQEISKLLWSQAIKNRDMRMQEMASMGIGNKPCLDLKPSEDNINDRFVNVSVSSDSKARMRHSVSGTCVDTSKGQKRPHSIISISSSSSSGSGSTGSHPHYSQYVMGQYNMLDSERGLSHPRSSTLMSNESGICMDMSIDGSDDSSTRLRRTSNVSQPMTTPSPQTRTEKLHFPIDNDSGIVYTDV